MPQNTQEKSEAILTSIDELFYDVECGVARERSAYIAAKPPQCVTSETCFSLSMLIFFVDFHFLMHNPG